jgi:hypothetical protein
VLEFFNTLHFGLYLNAVPGEEAEVIIPFIKQYVETRNEINKNFKIDYTS